MYLFRDFYHNEVRFSFADHPFSSHPRHVFVICTYHDQWLLTKHQERGLEFPGGKVEGDETAKQGAIREVKEETGGKIQEPLYVGQYLVKGQSEQVIKNVYHGRVKELLPQNHYYETLGPVLLNDLPKNIRSHPSFSFIMKDDVLTHSLQRIQKYL